MSSPLLSPVSLRAITRRLLVEPPGALYSLSSGPRRLRGIREYEVDEPEDLIGLTADPAWPGVAVVMEGRAFDADGGEAPVTFAFALDRSGRCAVATAIDGRSTDVATAPSGLIADIAHRMLGLETPPAYPTPESLLTRQWLERLLDAAADPATAALVADWPGAARLHPLVTPRCGGGAESVTIDGAEWAVRSAGPVPHEVELAERTMAAARRWPWRRMHASAALGELALGGLTLQQVAWMDWPFFARWTLAVHRPVMELLDDLSLFLGDDLLEAVRCTVEAVSWLGFADRGLQGMNGDE